jgi:hypothetical protein
MSEMSTLMSKPNQLSSQAISPALPWWRYKMLWLVIGGPLIVVIAATATAVIAIRGADVVLPTDASTVSHAKQGVTDTLTPAIEARNHAATGTK